MAESNDTPRSPRQEVEACLAELWMTLLGLRAVDIHDNFLDLGGDSVFVARLTSRICERFGVSLHAATIFDHPTIAETAAHLTQHADFQNVLES